MSMFWFCQISLSSSFTFLPCCSASGVAVSLELARIFATYKPKATIVFTAFAGEEQGLLGAENLAKTYRNASVNIAAMINLDMVGK